MYKQLHQLTDDLTIIFAVLQLDEVAAVWTMAE
jgi:hypothetical protein